MNYRDFMDMTRDVPVSGHLEFEPAFMWVNSDRLPQRLCSIGEEWGPVIRVPAALKRKNGKSVPVISFSRDAFRHRDHITDIVLPSAIESIPEGAFEGCVNLRNITIPGIVNSIGGGTFRGCVSLQNVFYEGSLEDWKRIQITHAFHKVEFGDLTPRSPVQQIVSERLEFIPGNEALLTACIHLNCELERYGGESSFSIRKDGKDITMLFSTDRRDG